MKHNKLALALLATTMSSVTLSTGAMASDVTVYGKLNLSLNHIEKDQAGVTDQDNWELESFTSRIGFKGSEAISEQLKVIYKLEYQVVPDGEGDVFKTRNSYAGLQGNFGTVIAGIHDTPLKMSQGKVDVFNDYSLGDIALSIPGERRENDIIIYTAPKMGDVSFSVGIMPGDDSGQDGDDNDNGLVDQISAAVSYQNDNLYAAFAIDDNVNGLDIIRVSATYKIGDVTLGALAQTAEDSDKNNGNDISGNAKGAIVDVLNDYNFVADDHDSIVLSAAWNINAWTLKAQIVESTYENSTADLDNSAFTIGADYKLSKRTKLYSHFTQLTVDSNAAIGLAKDYEYTGLGLMGIEHKF